MKRQESAENYLETILMLKNTLGDVRSVDIAGELGFSKPSVSVAMKGLREKGLISVDHDGFITLTAEGQTAAAGVYERHRTLTEFLILLGVDEKTAAEDACRIEHDISETTFEKLKQHAQSHRQAHG